MNTSSPHPESARAAFDPRVLRACFGKFATGVTVVSLLTEGKPHGITVNSFTSVSLEPPLVLTCVDKGSRAAAALAHSSFVVNVLSAEQEDFAWHFSGRPRLSSVPWCHSSSELPFLPGAIARIFCTPWSVADGGDHLIVIGKVFELDSSEDDALAFFSGQFSRLPPGNAPPRAPDPKQSFKRRSD